MRINFYIVNKQLMLIKIANNKCSLLSSSMDRLAELTLLIKEWKSNW